MYLEQTFNGIDYTADIVSARGSSIVLYPEPKHTKEQIKAAKSWLRGERDIVSIRIADEADRDNLYKTQYFRHPKVKPLKWYEINTDEATIRRERRRHTSIDTFVEAYVLPLVEQTHQHNLNLYGDSIYNL